MSPGFAGAARGRPVLATPPGPNPTAIRGRQDAKTDPHKDRTPAVTYRDDSLVQVQSSIEGLASVNFQCGVNRSRSIRIVATATRNGSFHPPRQPKAATGSERLRRWLWWRQHHPSDHRLHPRLHRPPSHWSQIQCRTDVAAECSGFPIDEWHQPRWLDGQ